MKSLAVKDEASTRLYKDSRVLKECLIQEREVLNQQLLDFQKSKQNMTIDIPHHLKTTKSNLSKFVSKKLLAQMHLRQSQTLKRKLFRNWQFKLHKKLYLKSLIKGFPQNNIGRAFRIWYVQSCKRTNRLKAAHTINTLCIKFNMFWVKSSFSCIRVYHCKKLRDEISEFLNEVNRALHTNLKKDFWLRFEI